jgi:MFS transporter, DHA2 family, multidrug resistance protein
VHNQVHRVELLTNEYAGNPLLEERLRMLTANLAAHGYGPDAAHRGALALLEQQTMRQAAMLSYNDAWMLLLLTFILVSPAIFFLRAPRGRAGSPADAH